VTPDQPSSLGGAAFNPFAETAAPIAAHPSTTKGPQAPEGPGHALGLFVALACATALGRLWWKAAG